MLRLDLSRVEKDIPPAIEKIRLADVRDAPYIRAFCNEAMLKTFRIQCVEDIELLIMTSVLSLCQLNVKGDIIGFLSLREYPLVPSLHPMVWEEYIWSKYRTIELNARNTMWIHLICWNRRYGRDVVESMLKSVFMHDAYVHNIAMLKSILSCPQLIPGSSRAEAMFRRVQAMERGMPGDKLPALLIAERKEMCPRLRVRRAVEEDNDDIVPIMNRHSERLRDLYGDFYISELISRHPESERVLVVAEHKELAVGIMCLNTQINFESLEECFELSPFAGLRILDAPPHKHRSRDLESSAGVSETTADDTTDSILNMDLTTPTLGLSTDTIIKNKAESQGKVKWTKEEAEAEENKTEESRNLYDGGKSELLSLSMLEYLDLFTEDDEDLEFDIVNIDPELMHVPDFLIADQSLNRNVIDGRHKEKEKDTLDDILFPKKEKKKSIQQPVSPLPKVPDYLIRYSGTSNAFLLELCAMSDEYDERYAFDMLEATFELFPGRDYCIMSLPSNHAPMPILEHFTLVTPHSTRLRFINESLYVTHVNSIRGDVSVRRGEVADEMHLYNLLEHAPRRDALTSLYYQALQSRSLETFMLLAQKQPVGVVIVGPLEDGVMIRTQYDLEPESLGALTDGVILGGVMSPTMEAHARWFLRDVIRQTRYATLFWLSQPFAKGELCPKRNMMSLVERMVPVRPRILLPNLSGNKFIDRLFKDVAIPFALWSIERPLSSYPKVNVNNNIVVVGASRTGLAFIESLILGETSRYLTFSNLTLVSPLGLPTMGESLKAADIAIPEQGRYNDHYLKSVPFSFYVDIIPATLVEIDRRKRCIYFKGGGAKYYDDLVLTCGEQFQHPDYLKKALERVKEVRKGKICERVLMDNPKYQPDLVPPPPPLPENLFLINSMMEANLVFRKLLKMMAENREAITKTNRILVYGDCIEAYSCIAALLELGLTGDDIAFIENYPPEDFTALRINCFNDEVIDEKVQDQMEMLNIKIYRGWKLTKTHIHNNLVQSLSLMDAQHLIRVSCFALFYYGIKAIDLYAFKAINECGLVYDGGLVIGPKFETNDPNIFAAGTCCNYSRRLYATKHRHKYYNSEEVGESLADLFLRKLDPFIRCHSRFVDMDFLPTYTPRIHHRSHPSIPSVRISRLHLILPGHGRAWQPVVRYQSALYKAATLPGPLYYLKVRKPGPDIPMEVQLALPHQGHNLVTNKNDNYFRVHLNALHCVDAVTCLSKTRFSSVILTQLYGRHEAFFNKLLLRYQMGLIDDFFEYFKQPWMAAVYQETFQELLNNINNHELGAIYEDVKSKYAMMGESTTSMRESVTTMGAPPSEQELDTDTDPLTSCSDLPECKAQQVSQAKLEARTLRIIMNKYATGTSVQMERDKGPTDIPTECGQSAAMRDEVAAFWEVIDGERIVNEQIGRHIDKYAVPNPHYAMPKREYFLHGRRQFE